MLVEQRNVNGHQVLNPVDHIIIHHRNRDALVILIGIYLRRPIGKRPESIGSTTELVTIPAPLNECMKLRRTTDQVLRRITSSGSRMISYQEDESGVLRVFLECDVKNQDGLAVLPSGRTGRILIGMVGSVGIVEDVKLLVENIRLGLGLSRDRRACERRQKRYPISIERRERRDRRDCGEGAVFRRKSLVG